MMSSKTEENSPNLRDKILEHMEGWLTQTDDNSGEAALEAIRQVPHLVHLESDPLAFLRMYETLPEATRHVAVYWNKRVEIFGERAYLPMTLTGRGALSKEDVEAFKKFGFHVLTKHNGSTVAFYDQEVLSALKSNERERCLFYTWSTLANTLNFEKGVILLASLVETVAFDNETTLWLDSFPVFVSLVCVFSPSEPVRPLRIEKRSRVVAYSNLDAPQRKRELVLVGYQDAELPKSLGGTFGEKEMTRWLENQLDLEYEKYPDQDDCDGDSTNQSHNSEDDSARSQSQHDDKRDGYSQVGMRKPLLPEETQKFLEESLKSFEKTLDEIQDPGKDIYLEASKEAPHVVDSEAAPVSFLRCTGFDASKAVDRMIRYWKLRKDLFGDRAFLPMTQTGDGALSEDDVLVLSSGAIAILPNDANGRSVVISDRNRSLGDLNSNKDSKWRCFFYIFSVVSENKLSQLDGFVFIGVLVTPRVVEFYEVFATKCMEMCALMPSRLKACHFLMKPPKVGKKSQIEDMVSKARTIVKNSNGDCSLFHSSGSPDEIFLKLESFGLSRDGLPSVAGGEWKYEKFTKWQKRRRAQEHAQGRVDEVGPSKQKEDDLHDDSEGTEIIKERKRKLNIIHSRQKRERRRTEMEHLRDECSALSDKNNLLRRENARLESILQDAVSQVRKTEAPIVPPVAAGTLGNEEDIRITLALQELALLNQLMMNSQEAPVQLNDFLSNQLARGQMLMPPVTGPQSQHGLLNSNFAAYPPQNPVSSVLDPRFSALGLSGLSGASLGNLPNSNGVYPDPGSGETAGPDRSY